MTAAVPKAALVTMQRTKTVQLGDSVFSSWMHWESSTSCGGYILASRLVKCVRELDAISNQLVVTGHWRDCLNYFWW